MATLENLNAENSKYFLRYELMSSLISGQVQTAGQTDRQEVMPMSPSSISTGMLEILYVRLIPNHLISETVSPNQIF